MKGRRVAVAVLIGAILVTVGVSAVSSQLTSKQEVPDNLARHPAPEQPIPFSHKKHAAVGVECAFCHTNPNPGRQMAFPPTQTCMGCHVGIATDKPAIVKLAELSKTGRPIEWVRVYQLIPGITWNHRTHLRAGMQCVMCHGQVPELDRMAKVTSVTSMASCISCHEAHGTERTCQTCHVWPADQHRSIGD